MSRGYPNAIRRGPLSSPLPANQNKLIGVLLEFKPTGRRGTTIVPFSPGAAAKIARLARLARINPLINWAWLAYDIYRALVDLQQWSNKQYDSLRNWNYIECRPECLPGQNFGDRWKAGFVGGCYCWPYPFLTGNPMPITSGPFPSGKILEFKWPFPSITASAAKGMWSRQEHAPESAFISPIYQPQWLPPPVQLPYWIDPEMLPIRQPTGDPIAPPVSRRPSGDPRRINRRRVGHDDDGRVLRRRRLRPWEREATQIEAVVDSRLKPFVTVRNNPHQLRKPPPGEKELKKKASKALNVLLRAVGAFTETLDLVQAFWEAIPFQERPRGFHSPLDKARFIYDNFNLVDDHEVVVNIITDQIMDALIAMGAKQKQKVYESLGVPAGTANPDTWISKQAKASGQNPVKTWVRAAIDALVSEHEGSANALL